jgi:hypothetical protein
MGYGIPGDQLPIKCSEAIKTQNHLKWLHYCMVKDESLNGGAGPFLGVYCPLLADVLAGRGPQMNHHPGNLAYRALLESKLDMYDNAGTQDEKFHITLDVVMEVGAMGGRFLTRDPTNDWWVPITDQDAARLKVSVAFRDLRKISKARSLRKKVKTGVVASLSSKGAGRNVGQGGGLSHPLLERHRQASEIAHRACFAGNCL